jgi:hypothetical protein
MYSKNPIAKANEMFVKRTVAQLTENEMVSVDGGTKIILMTPPIFLPTAKTPVPTPPVVGLP